MLSVLLRRQAEKMGVGGLRYTVTFYPRACLVHVNLAPLVVTFVHSDGDGTSPNFGESLDMIPDITAALEPLRAQVRGALSRYVWRVRVIHSERLLIIAQSPFPAGCFLCVIRDTSTLKEIASLLCVLL